MNREENIVKRDEREIIYYNMAKLARDVGVSYRTIQNIWSQKTSPRTDLAMRIAEELGMTVEELMEGIANGRLKPLRSVRDRGANE